MLRNGHSREEKRMNEIKVFTRTDDGGVSKVIEYSSGARVEIPINRDGTVKWYEDRLKKGVAQDEKIHS